MKPSELKELQEKAALWDSLNEWLKDKFVEKFPYSETIQNTCNASSHVGVLEEESKEMVEVKEGEIKFTGDPRTHRPFCPL